ncbi:hypothetical protein GCM10027030_18740 [Luteococcus sediminum]
MARVVAEATPLRATTSSAASSSFSRLSAKLILVIDITPPRFAWFPTVTGIFSMTPTPPRREPHLDKCGIPACAATTSRGDP